ncbi:hypothetical protein FH972_022698 [Carpinus fangiana]|uniref:Uncharacterized protein n=1 Tax=Carpinus fangiana TaxID=176857 RepID=A0A5N6KTH8_9ROSI|nr:hypothetical protein FH972_022698 [Carpinus fangiana]
MGGAVGGATSRGSGTPSLPARTPLDLLANTCTSLLHTFSTNATAANMPRAVDYCGDRNKAAPVAFPPLVPSKRQPFLVLETALSHCHEAETAPPLNGTLSRYLPLHATNKAASYRYASLSGEIHGATSSCFGSVRLLCCR